MIKNDFENKGKMREYINKFILRNTTLEKKCQYCGKPAQVKYNYLNPYEVQFICLDCKVKKHINKYPCDALISDLPSINILDYLTEEKKKKERMYNLTEENKLIIKKLAVTPLSKKEALQKYDLTEHRYRVLVEAYKKQVDSNIDKKLKENFKRNQTEAIKKWTATRGLEKSANNLAKLKIEKGLSNRDIDRLSNHKLIFTYISVISTGKIIPSIKTKCLLAKIFNVSVGDIFPQDWLYSKVYNYEDYAKLNKEYREQLIHIINKKKNNNETAVVFNISKRLNISATTIYDFIRGHNLEHESLVNIVSNIDDLL